MSDTGIRQRLAAILVADVAGYSRLMATDERSTVEALDAARGVFKAEVESHQGRVIDMAGDSVLAVFETAAEVQRVWLEGRREDAAALVPDELVLKTNLLGTEAMVKDRIRAYRDAGITTLRVEPDGATTDARLATLGRLVEMVRSLT